MQSHLAAGNRLWEWYSVGRYGTAGYDVKAQKFVGEEWPEVGPPPDSPQRHYQSGGTSTVSLIANILRAGHSSTICTLSDTCP